MPPKTRPNEKCRCGSDKKYKKCCMRNDQIAKSSSTQSSVAPPINNGQRNTIIDEGDAVRYYDGDVNGWIQGIVRKKGTIQDVRYNDGGQGDAISQVDAAETEMMRHRYVEKTVYRVLPYGHADNEANMVTVLDTGRNIFPLE